MTSNRRPPRTLRAASAHLDELLDEALKQTFPASDPIAIDVASSPTRESSRVPAGRAAQAGTKG
jgi:hypothetical protein